VGQGFQFGGTNFVQVPTDTALNNMPLTLMAWLRTTATNTSVRGVLSKYQDGSGNGYSLHLANSNIYAWYYRSPASYVTPGGLGLNGGAVADGNWHHVAFAVDETGGKLYVDGSLQATQGWIGSAGAPSTTRPLLIGRYDSYTSAFDGMIDEPAVYSRALSATEIQSILAASGDGLCVPPSLAISSFATNVQLRVTGTVGEPYQIQTAPAVTGPWTGLSPAQLADPAGHVGFTDSTPASQRFYRATAVNP